MIFSYPLVSAFLTHISSILITVVTFAAYTLTNDNKEEFNSANIFAALALFNQLTVPLFIFPITIPIIISCIISTKRVERFLSQPEVAKELREGVRNMARILCKSQESLDDDHKSDNEDEGKKQICNKLFMAETIDEEESTEEKLLMEIKINDHEGKLFGESDDLMTGDVEGGNRLENFIESQDDVVVLRNKSNKIKLRKQNQLSTSTRLERNRLRSSTAAEPHNNGEGKTINVSPSFKVPDEIIVCITNARFRWNGENDLKALEIDQLSIPKGIQADLGVFCYEQSGNSKLIENHFPSRKDF